MLDRDILDAIWEVPTVNRLNLATAFLVLLAGTGADHRTTAWSAKACEDRVGMGKPRAKKAIEELILSGLAEKAPDWEPNKPKYLLRAPKFEKEPIFLPVQLITGFFRETAVVRRVRETGDAELLRMLLDLYGELQVDATFGVPLSALSTKPSESAIKVSEVGANAIWAVTTGGGLSAKGDWIARHKDRANKNAPWDLFWNRVRLLQQIGALRFEPWLFDSESDDAEPIMPIEPLAIYAPDDSDVSRITQLAYLACVELASSKSYLLERYADHTLIPLPSHHRQPAVRGVAKLVVEADTPGRRRAFAKRKSILEARKEAFETLTKNASTGSLGRPLSLTTHGAR